LSNNHLNPVLKNYYSDLSQSSRLSSSIAALYLNSDINQKFLDLSRNSLNINSTSDGKYYNNPLKIALNSSNVRRLALDLPFNGNLDLIINLNLSEVTNKFANTESSSKFKELKSGNMSFLSPDKNTRLIDKLHSSKGQLNFSNGSSNLDDVLNRVHTAATDENEIYSSSNLSWVSPTVIDKVSSLNISTGNSNSPIYSNNSS
jgi:hypothetical protein